MLSVQDVADVLGISMSGAYELVKEKGFPHPLHTSGRADMKRIDLRLLNDRYTIRLHSSLL